MDSSPLFAGCSLSTLSLCLPPIFCMSACLSINGSSNDEWVSCWSDLHCCHPSKYESSQHTERSQRPQVPCRFVHAIKLEHFCLLTSNSHQHHTQTSKQQCCSIDNSGPLVRGGGAPPQSTDELCRLSRWTAEVVVGFIKVSVRQKRSGLWVSTRSHSAAERRGWRISGCWECTEWRLKDRGWVQCLRTEERTKEQKRLRKRRVRDRVNNKKAAKVVQWRQEYCWLAVWCGEVWCADPWDRLKENVVDRRRNAEARKRTKE